MPHLRVGLALTLGCLMLGCASQQSTVTQRHASQFDCSAGQLSVTEISDSVWLVKGCGPKATYLCTAKTTCVLESVEGGDTTVSPKE
ncbi:MAG: hypothetical protein H6718_04205 [Polyangiaceae bacterium]|nr:hypothetical protein [Polyangiaceae bacterium]